MTDTHYVAAFLDKGGTGKTTCAAHTAVAAADRGLDVLAVDLAGKQGDLGKHFGIWDAYRERISDDDAWPNIATTFSDDWEMVVKRLGEDVVDELLVATDEGIDLIPAHPDLDGLDDDLGTVDDPADRYSRFRAFCKTHIEPLGYDLVVIDLPGLTNNITYNGLLAAENVLAPVEAGPFEAGQVRVLDDDLKRFAETFDVDVRLAQVVLNKLDTRTKLASEYLKDYRDRFGETLAPEPVPMSQDIRNAAEHGQTVFALESPSRTAERARDAFLANTDALLTTITDD